MCVCVCVRLCASLCTAQSEASSSCKLYHLISSDPAFVCPMAGLEGRSDSYLARWQGWKAGRRVISPSPPLIFPTRSAALSTCYVLGIAVTTPAWRVTYCLWANDGGAVSDGSRGRNQASCGHVLLICLEFSPVELLHSLYLLLSCPRMISSV